MPYTSDSWTFGHVPTTFKRLPTVNRWGVLHGFYSDQRDDQELSNSAPDMPSGVGFRILSNRIIWRFPNNGGSFSYLYTSNAGWTGGFQNLNGGTDIGWTTSGSVAPIYNLTLGYNASWSHPLYGASNTNQPSAIRVLSLVKAYQA